MARAQQRYQQFEDYDPAVDKPDVDPFASAKQFTAEDLFRKPVQGPLPPQATGSATGIKATSTRDALANAMASLAETLTGKDYNEAQRDSHSLLGVAPGTGSMIAAEDAAADLKRGDYAGAGINALGAIPDFGPVAKAALIGSPAYRRLAEEMLTKKARRDIEWFHPVGGDVKLQRPFSDMTSTTRPTGPMTPSRPLDPADLQGGTILPLYGDRTRAGETLTHINDKALPREQALGGGGRFMQENPGSIWASEKGRITTMADKVRQAEKMTEGGPVFGVHVAMGPESGDFAKMTTRPLLDMAKEAPITRKAAKQFDTEAVSDWGIKGWPGIKTAGDDWLATAPGGQRADLPKIMQKAEYQKLGFPDVASLRKAITEPDLLHEPMTTSGLTVGQFDPGGRIINNPTRPHDTYSTQIGGNYLGDLGQVPIDVMFPDLMKTRGANPPLPQTGRTIETQMPMQAANQEWLDGLMRWLEARRR